MTLPIITGYAAAILALLQVVLMLLAGNARNAKGISVGDGGDEELLYKLRRHGNLTENAPLFLILLALLEISGGSLMAVEGFAIVFIVARLSHAYALSGPGRPLPTRVIGALGTVIGILGAAGTLVWHLSSLG